MMNWNPPKEKGVNAQYYQVSSEGYTICKNANRYFASDPKKQFIGGPFKTSLEAQIECDEHFRKNNKESSNVGN